MNWKTIFIAIALFFSSTTYAQIALDWETDSQFKYIYLNNGLIIGEFRYKHFVVTSGSGYIDVVATLDDAGTSTTTRIWVEEGISYGTKVSLNWVATRRAEPGEACFRVTFGSPDFSSTGTFTY